MPKMVSIGANPRFEAKTPEAKALLEAVRKAGPIQVAYPTARENILASGGLYMILSDEPAPVAAGPRALDDMGNDELKAMLLTAGVVPQKQMKRADIIKAIRQKMDAIQIVDDEESGAA
jgi:hypothetical protein